MKLKKPHKKGNHYRYRIKSPRAFIKSSMRTQDIGRKGHSKRIAGRLKKNNMWATQAILIHKDDYEQGKRVKIVRGKPVIYDK